MSPLQGSINLQDCKFRRAKRARRVRVMEDPNQSLSTTHSLTRIYETPSRYQFPQPWNPGVVRVGPRTVDPCEPRQVRKEAAAAG